MKQKKKGGKRTIIQNVMARGISARQAAKAVNTVFRLMSEALSYHESVEVPGVGTLEVIVQKGRPKRRDQKIRNVATKEIEVHNMNFPGRRRVVKLRPDPHLRLAASPPPTRPKILADLLAAWQPRETTPRLETPEQAEARQLASALLGRPADQADLARLQEAVEVHPCKPGSLLRRLRQFRDRGWQFHSLTSLAHQVEWHYWL